MARRVHHRSGLKRYVRKKGSLGHKASAMHPSVYYKSEAQTSLWCMSMISLLGPVGRAAGVVRIARGVQPEEHDVPKGYSR